VWLATFLAAGAFRGVGARTFVATTAVASIVLPGVVPIGDFPSADASMVMSIAYTLLLIAFNAWVVGEAAGVMRSARSAIEPLYRTEPGRAHTT
jgi:hypothetical protein